MHPSQNSPRTGRFRRFLGGAAIVGALAVAGSIATGHYFRAAQATATATAAEQAVPVTVALIEPKQTVLWDDFSGRLEAINRVELRPRVAGAILATNFTEGALVKAGDVLFKIDPAPYAAEVDKANAQLEGPRRASCSPRASSSAARSWSAMPWSRGATTTSATTPIAKPSPM
ncbi:multidrug efflux pump subunit AcrA (membrane-fusion protein) [Bradyrhizobium japonicum]|jgi:multidrug efflux system membrane fusion protein